MCFFSLGRIILFFIVLFFAEFRPLLFALDAKVEPKSLIKEVRLCHRLSS
jgi:hypothetical protein